MGPARLVVNADDFGFTEDVNEGIIACHREGILTATTLMATGRSFRHAVRLAKENPSLDVGCHLVLVQGPGQPASVPGLMGAIALGLVDVHAELARQVRILLKAGIRPTHLDTHKHTHLAPPVLKAMLRVAEEYGIPWIRKPVDFALEPNAARAKQRLTEVFRLATRSFDRRLERAGRRRTDHFAGFQLTGFLRTENLAELIRGLPGGSTELMCHPGYLREGLSGAVTRLKQSREVELRALCSAEVKRAVQESNIQLSGYRDL